MVSFRRLRDALVTAQPGPEFPYGVPLAARLEEVQRDPLFRAHLEELRAEAERAASTPLEGLPFSLFHLFETTGDRREYERSYFDRRRKLLGLVLTTLLDDTDEYLSTLQDLLWEVCNEYTWSVPAHLPVGLEAVKANRLPPEEMVDLFAAETAHALAETLFLVGDRLDPWLHHRVRSEIERRVFRPLGDPVRFWWESAPMNWASVCAGAVGMAALLLEGDRERLAGLLKRVLDALEVFLEGFGDDGGCPEGIGYWVYGFGYYVYFAEMLCAYTGGALDLLEGEKVRAVAAFARAVSLGGDRFVNFSDAPSHTLLPTGLVSRLVARLEVPVPELTQIPSPFSDRCYRWPHATRNLLWTDPALLHHPTPEGTVYLPDLGWLTDRRRLGGVTVAFSAKGGHNGEPHNHNDVGHFILHVGGESLLADLGAGLYTRDYFRGDRGKILQIASAGHSVPIIAGAEQREGRAYEGVMLRREDEDGALTFALDLTRAYELPVLASFVRTFVWRVEEGRATLELTDRFRFTEAPPSLVEVFISLHQPRLEDRSVTWQGARGRVVMTFEEGFMPTVEALESADHRGEPMTVYRTRLNVSEPSLETVCSFAFSLEPGAA